MSDLQKTIYETITDEELRTPVGELSEGRSFVIEHVLRGPYGEELMARIKALSEQDSK